MLRKYGVPLVIPPGKIPARRGARRRRLRAEVESGVRRQTLLAEGAGPCSWETTDAAMGNGRTSLSEAPPTPEARAEAEARASLIGGAGVGLKRARARRSAEQSRRRESDSTVEASPTMVGPLEHVSPPRGLLFLRQRITRAANIFSTVICFAPTLEKV
ncbi:hypothetical protein NL676_033004 [Syzygium grande]|nr:hypothetical protein NL676_033004 [Syzygium grande]